MDERMLNQEEHPTLASMAEYCGESGGLFSALNAWLAEFCRTSQEITFPYGRHYGWGVTHRIKRKLICHVFAEQEAFTVMLRLSDSQYASIMDQVQPDTRELIEHRYPCGDGGWIHLRVTHGDQFADAQRLLSQKCGLK